VGIHAKTRTVLLPGSKSTPARTYSQNGNPQKINPESVKYFQPQNTTINSPRNHHNPPQIHHQKTTSNHPFSPKPPAKTQKTFPQKKTIPCGDSEEDLY
jgi:hypothetical protein